MALTLKELFEKRSDPDTRTCVIVARWRHAKALLTKADASGAELKQAMKLLTDAELETYIKAVCVLIDDGDADDTTIQNAVDSIAAKFVELEV